MQAGTNTLPLLDVQHLSVSLQDKQVLKDLDFTCSAHQIVAIVGIEGAGKTTLLKALGGLQRPVAGRIWFEGESVEALSAWEMVRRGVVYVPEGMRVFPGMTVLENLEVGAYLVRPHLKANLDKVCQIFPELKDRLEASAGILSGGQQRMVTLARGLMAAPRLLMLDEPFMGLSPKLVQRFCNSFRDLRQAGVTLLISGQLMQRVLNVAEKAYVLEKGCITRSGTGPHLLQDPHLQEIILPL
ncbi:MAG: ABC transporter ATP-binding protein [Thermodesulfobacteriota bacterium]